MTECTELVGVVGYYWYVLIQLLGTSNIVFERNVPTQEGMPAGPKRPKVEEPEVEGPKVEGPEVEGPKVEGPKVEGPKVERPKVEGPKVERPKVEGPKVERPKVEGPKVERPGETKVAKAEGARRCWEEVHDDPVAALLRHYELQTATYTAPMDPANGTKIIFSHGGQVGAEGAGVPPADPRPPPINAVEEVSISFVWGASDL